jgi:uncharacterized integral membrane protein (TIGR00698 family)
MSNGERTPVIRSEDWWACFIGLFILLLAIIGLHEVAAGKFAVSNIVPHGPKLGKNWTTLAAAFPKGFGTTLGQMAIHFIFLAVLTMIGGAFMKFDLKRYLPGFLVIYILAVIATVIAKQQFLNKWGISYVIFALAFGLIISNIFKVPKFLQAGGQTEFFIKIGLVCMGANILFIDIVRGGLMGLVQALLVATTVWFMTYWICRKFKVSERFSAIIASANAICGVSATIAAGGAIMGDKKEVSYMVAWVLVCAVVLILVMPPIAKGLNLPNNWAGAWVGGVIDNTGAVVAAGGIIGGEAAFKTAALVKMAQNVLIGFAAFFMALWATMTLDRKELGDAAEKPSLTEVWYRFPKFVLGFIIASLIVSFIVEPAWSHKAAKAVGGIAKGYRNWLFALCFVSIGLETNFKELVSVGGGRPAAAYWISQTLNAIWTLFITWILWSGYFFTPAIPAD